ncbi:nucleotide exchange factor GrpE [bacterium]|nr:nucleotide exchange factor GrpE [bacterium]
MQNEHKKWEKELYLEIFEILDTFENILEGMEEKRSETNGSFDTAIKNLRAIHKKILRLLSRRGIEQIEFPGNKALFGMCKIVETKAVPNMENESIISISRKGYRKKDGAVIRPAEVITVLN